MPVTFEPALPSVHYVLSQWSRMRTSGLILSYRQREGGKMKNALLTLLSALRCTIAAMIK